MPFIVQCPYPNCQKYNLVEDSSRDGAVKCLSCKNPIKLDPSTIERGPAPRRSPETAGAKRPSERYLVRNCPECKMPMRVPSSAANQRIQCPECSHVFK